jgi:uridine phosphorylase
VTVTKVPAPTVSSFYAEGEPHLSPARLAKEYCEIAGITIEELGIKPVLVATFFPVMTSFIAESSGAVPGPHRLPGGRDRELHVLDDAISLATLSMGAPTSVMEMEELIACGVRTLVLVGAAGSLQPSVPIASVVVPANAIREEGTSHHYLPPEVPAVADAAVVEALRAAWKGAGSLHAGLHWTTDAPYREHKERIEAYRQAGVLSVDMEVSALYCLAQHRGLRCAAILAISDELFEPWRIGFRMPEFQLTMVQVGQAAIEAARALAREEQP